MHFHENTGPIPTRDGDIVISHDPASRSLYSVWHVTTDAQQACGLAAEPASSALGRPAALRLAHLLAVKSRGADFFVDPVSGQWTKIES